MSAWDSNHPCSDTAKALPQLIQKSGYMAQTKIYSEKLVSYFDSEPIVRSSRPCLFAVNIHLLLTVFYDSLVPLTNFVSMLFRYHPPSVFKNHCRYYVAPKFALLPLTFDRVVATIEERRKERREKGLDAGPRFSDRRRTPPPRRDRDRDDRDRRDRHGGSSRKRSRSRSNDRDRDRDRRRDRDRDDRRGSGRDYRDRDR
ncbi:hypothetical protein Y032_0134g1818 [Ancylostoma ceylanicum]|nr:hypothetical protein Y032_0134g1818 [Ancylostoma ceylanicum]